MKWFNPATGQYEDDPAKIPTQSHDPVNRVIEFQIKGFSQYGLVGRIVRPTGPAAARRWDGYR